MTFKASKVIVLREAITKVTQILAGKRIRVVQQGMEARVEYDGITNLPKVVYLPMLPDDATDELCDAIQGFLDHEVAKVLFSDPHILSRVKQSSEQFKSLFGMIEGPFVEGKMSGNYRGSGSNLETTGKFYLKNFVEPKVAAAKKAGDSKAELALMMPTVMRALSGQFIYQEALKKINSAPANELYDKLKDMSDEFEACESSKDVYDLSDEVIRRMKGEKSKGKDDEDDEQDGKPGKPGKPKGDKGEGKQSKSPSGKGDEDGEADQPDAGDQPGEGDAEGEGEGSGEGESEGDQDGDAEGEGGADGGDSSDGDQNGLTDQDMKTSLAPNKHIPENSNSSKDSKGAGLDWDDMADALKGSKDFDDATSEIMGNMAEKAALSSDYIPYSTEKDVIEPLNVPASMRDKAIESCNRRIEEPVSAMVGPMQKDLERAIAARSAAIMVGGFKSGKLHGSSLHRIMANDERVFRRKEQANTKDVVVELVVDASGSMGGSKMLTATRAAFALSSVLERLRIKNEVICFTTGHNIMDYSDQSVSKIKYARTENIVMPIIKDMNEPLNSTVRARFGHMPQEITMHSNIDGESVEYAARRLLSHRAARHVMIVLSDGEPAGHGLAGRSTLMDDLKRRVKKLEAGGIDVVGIGIESNAVKAFYSKCVVIHNVTELPVTVIKQLRGLLIPR